MMILHFLHMRNERNAGGPRMTKERLAELEAQYPDVPRKKKENG